MVADLNLLAHLLIAGAYVVLAASFQFVSVPSRLDTIAIRVGAALFFIGCAAHHLDVIGHLIQSEPLSGASLHHALPSLMQVIGAPMFLIAFTPYAFDFFAHMRRRV